MAARWVNLIRQLDATLDAADRDLSDSDRIMFCEHAIHTLHSRRERRPRIPVQHPTPGHTPDHYRDPSGT